MATTAPIPEPNSAASQVQSTQQPETTSLAPKDINSEVPDKDNQLPPAPNPPFPLHPDFLHCLPPVPPIYRKFSLFLAGSIEMGAAIHWQTRMVSHLQNLPITICNPRRGHWDVTTTPREKDEAFNRQVQWELSALETVSVICFFFDKNTRSPVTMLELGLWAKSGKVVVCCDSGFWKAGNVHITCRRYGIPFVETFGELVGLIKGMLGEKGMRLDGNNDVVDENGARISNEGPTVANYDSINTGIKVSMDERPLTEVQKEKEEDKKTGSQAGVETQQQPGTTKSTMATAVETSPTKAHWKETAPSSEEKKHGKLSGILSKLTGKRSSEA